MPEVVQNELEIIRKGNPRWLVFSGIHGNEGGVIASVRQSIEFYFAKMPPFLWITNVSPSALALGKRNNKRGKDVNRCFCLVPTEPEVVTALEMIRGIIPDLFLDFHEDPDQEHLFYFYDSYNWQDAPELKDFWSELGAFGIRPFSGLDDPELGNIINNGYYLEVPPMDISRYPLDETAADYMRRCVGAARSLTFEIPGRAKQEVKDVIVRIIFKYLLRWRGTS